LHFTYNPLRPQTTIAIDHVNKTNNETQPSVKISIPVSSKLKLQNNSELYNTSNGVPKGGTDAIAPVKVPMLKKLGL